MMKKLTIFVDMDDTIEQLLKAWVIEANQRYGYSVSCDEVTDWDVTLAFPGLTMEQVYEIPTLPGFWKDVDPVPGAAEALQHFMAEGHDVYIVTATPYESVPEKMNDCLFKLFPFLKWDQLIITFHKQLLQGDVLIDDGVHNLEGGSYTKVLMTAPHNRSYDAEANGMIRVNNWSEAIAVVDRLAGK